mgnify:CR=1 FL=1
MSLDLLILAVVSILGSSAIVYLLISKSIGSKTTVAKINPEQTADAKAESKKIVLEAKTDALKIKEDAEKEAQRIRREALSISKKAEEKLDELLKKSKAAQSREDKFKHLSRKWKNKNEEIEKLRLEQIEKLKTIASLTKEEAKQLILSNLEKSLQNEKAKKIKESEQQIQAEADKIAREILVEAMQHGATDYVPEYTISTIKIQDEDIKGRIIGKEGRNIRAFEDATGVNVDFEDKEVRLSSFDSVRREVARLSMEKLIKDGRIHPARIEELVKKTQTEVDKVITKAGEELCQKVGVYNLPNDIVKKLGNFKYRTSYGQNMIQHTLEETQIGVKIAKEIGADVAVTKLACLLHDIGKVITDQEGSHIELGVDFLKKYKIPKPVLSAVAEHHDDKPSSVEGVIVQIADSISGSRPGARYEDYENYVKRMNELEDAALSFEGVDKAFAISAGRELRVIVKAEDIDDAKAVNLSADIAKKIEEEQTYPGTVKVIVIRETRAVSTAT